MEQEAKHLINIYLLFAFVNVKRTIAFLQQCALRSQDFAIYHTEYIEFENPDRCGSALIQSGLGTENLMSVQCNFPRA